MKAKLEKKNHFRKNPNLLMNIFIEWMSHNSPCTAETVLDRLHLTPQSFEYICKTKNNVDKDVIIGKLYEKYLEINGKFKKFSNPGKSIMIHDMILSRDLTPIDYSDVLVTEWKYENFRWLVYKLQSLNPGEDVIKKYILNDKMEKYIRLMSIDNMNRLRDYIECILERDSIMAVPEYIFSGICRVLGYILGINSFFLEGKTTHPILFDEKFRLNMVLFSTELSRMLLLYHYDNSVFDMNDEETEKLVTLLMGYQCDNRKVFMEILKLENLYDINLTTLILPLAGIEDSTDKVKSITSAEFKTMLKHYNEFVVL